MDGSGALEVLRVFSLSILPCQMGSSQIVLKSAFLWGVLIRWLYELSADCVEAYFRAAV